MKLELMTDDELVRLFVKNQGNLPLQQLAYDSILKKTNYRLPIKTNDLKSCGEQHEILTRIGNDCRKNEKIRKLKEHEIQKATRCKTVESLSGAYEYIDIDTFCKVDACVYEDRYMTYLASQKLSASLYISSTKLLPDKASANTISKKLSIEPDAFDILVAAANSVGAAIITATTNVSFSGKKRSIIETSGVDASEDGSRSCPKTTDYTAIATSITRDMNCGTLGLTLA